MRSSRGSIRIAPAQRAGSKRAIRGYRSSRRMAAATDSTACSPSSPARAMLRSCFGPRVRRRETPCLRRLLSYLRAFAAFPPRAPRIRVTVEIEGTDSLYTRFQENYNHENDRSSFSGPPDVGDGLRPQHFRIAGRHESTGARTRGNYAQT